MRSKHKLWKQWAAVFSTGTFLSLPVQGRDAHPYVNGLGMKFVAVPGTNILMCTTETTVQQYKAAGTGYRSPVFEQGPSHPAINISWNDAQAWCRWMTQKEGRVHRLPTDAEWSQAAGGGNYPWGEQWPPPPTAGNYAGQEVRQAPAALTQKVLPQRFNLMTDYTDAFPFTSAVGQFRPNALGLYDMGGNAWEWCEDTYQGNATYRVVRGGSWFSNKQEFLRTRFQAYGAPAARFSYFGFRCVVQAPSR